MEHALKIGELASAVGVSCDTVRYYERLNLLPRAARTRAGYRLYTEVDVERLRFIKQAQALGLSLEEIKELLPGRGAGLAECQRVHDLLSTKLKELDARIAEMRAFRRTLAAYFDECEKTLAGKRGDCCPVLFDITHTAPRQRSHTPTIHRQKKEVFKKR